MTIPREIAILTLVMCMKIIGIICEYNPFHNGHLYHLEKIKEMFPDSLIVLVLNGYFLERGEISIISKKNKTELALEAGIDLVLELPFIFGTQSADIFADAALKILNEVKCEYLIFGSESNDLTTLKKLANYQITEEKEYNQKVQKYLNMGINYPTSLAKALDIDFDFKPNDLLGISYIKAIKNSHYKITPISIKRTNDYLDTTSNEKIVSASNIREKLKNKKNIAKYVPEMTLSKIENITLEDYFPYLKYKIITEDNLDIYLDVTEGIDNRLKKVILSSNSLEELITKTKSKRYTYNKIRRMLIHILVGLKKSDAQNLSLEYLKVLGFTKKGQQYLNKIKKEVNIPLTPLKNSLTYTLELKCAQLYDFKSKDDNLKFENSNKPLKL